MIRCSAIGHLGLLVQRHVVRGSFFVQERAPMILMHSRTLVENSEKNNHVIPIFAVSIHKKLRFQVLFQKVETQQTTICQMITLLCRIHGAIPFIRYTGQ